LSPLIPHGDNFGESIEIPPALRSVLYPLHIRLPSKEINTGYGVKLIAGGQSLSHYLDLAKETGFEVLGNKQEKGWFFIELKKPE
jgi:hypothetical protein